MLDWSEGPKDTTLASAQGLAPKRLRLPLTTTRRLEAARLVYTV